MTVSIEIKGNLETNEYKYGQKLKDIFLTGLPKEANGKIVILTGVTLFGEKIRDIDLIVYGDLDNCIIDIDIKSNIKILISNFLFCIEAKASDLRDVMLDGTILKVKYKGKWSDATTQSENQKYALKRYIERETKQYSPYICNFIWTIGIAEESLKGLIGESREAQNLHNYLPSNLTIAKLFHLAAIQKKPRSNDRGYYDFSSTPENNNTIDLISKLDFFLEVRKNITGLTRSKIEKITKGLLLKDQTYAKEIGKKLIVISGRAGTGKTSKLLKIAVDLALEKGSRCLILTYNTALVSDISRLLVLAGIPDSVTDYTVNITTLSKFFFELILGLNISHHEDKLVIPDFTSNYKDYLQEMHDYIKNGLITQKDVEKLMVSRHDQVAWDFILVDEAQDWPALEKEILYMIFGPSKIIIADGMDQMVRSQKLCDWTYKTPHHKTFEKRCLRQKKNIIDFVNVYAKEFNLHWDLEPVADMEGGRIIITGQKDMYNLLKIERDNNKTSGNSNYDMMFLVPPAFVSKDKGMREFILTEDFKANGFDIWDGTQKKKKAEYPTSVTEHRLFQYDSCRGLEAWTVVCLGFDTFVKYKTETIKESDFENKADLLQDNEYARNRFIYLWSLIPLTRAIDTIVIVLENLNSPFSKRLRLIANKMPDFVEIVE